jgi:hypothetical protein
MMVQKIEIFVFILSLIFCLKHLIHFIAVLNQEIPEPMKVGVMEKVLLYFASSYIITAIIMIFL